MKRRCTAGLGQSGFTLIELLVVVAILGLVAALSVPQYLRWHAASQLKQATTHVTWSLNLARMTALNQNRSVLTTIALTGDQVATSFTDGSGGEVLPTAIERASSMATITGGPVQFNSMGLRTGGGGTQVIVLTNRYGLAYSVGVTAGGKVRWCANPACT